ncbi:MAG: formylglycine-generating enzyme family protein [Magnetococcales bacterium]|nr:formylglycine-generating enzyme family protein [Magnetococcales bacterium]
MKETLLQIQRRLQKGGYSHPDQLRLNLCTALFSALGWDLSDPKEVDFSFIPPSGSTEQARFLALRPAGHPHPSAIVQIMFQPVGKETPLYLQPPIPFHILTDGTNWRFYFLEARQTTTDNCFKTFNLLQTPAEEVENFLRQFMSVEVHHDNSACEKLERKLTLNTQKRLEPLRQLLPKAQLLATRPPNPTLERAMQALVARMGLLITPEEIHQFLEEQSQQADVAQTTASVITSRENREWTEPVTGMVFLWVPAGSFTMGSPEEEPGRQPNEGPLHQVTLDSFWLSKYPVTQAQWRTVMESGNRSSAWARNRPKSREEEEQEAKIRAQQEASALFPVENCLWEQTQEFITKLGLLGGSQAKQLRLPTEAEWEYAARAGTTGSYFFAESRDNPLDDYAWYSTNSLTRLQKIGLKKPNPWGFHDLLGSVWEWVADLYALYGQESQSNPTGGRAGDLHVRRGGSYRSNAKACRVARRNQVKVDAAELQNSGGLGFRLAKPDSN